MKIRSESDGVGVRKRVESPTMHRAAPAQFHFVHQENCETVREVEQKVHDESQLKN